MLEKIECIYNQLFVVYKYIFMLQWSENLGPEDLTYPMVIFPNPYIIHACMCIIGKIPKNGPFFDVFQISF